MLKMLFTLLKIILYLIFSIRYFIVYHFILPTLILLKMLMVSYLILIDLDCY